LRQVKEVGHIAELSLGKKADSSSICHEFSRTYYFESFASRYVRLRNARPPKTKRGGEMTNQNLSRDERWERRLSLLEHQLAEARAEVEGYKQDAELNDSHVKKQAEALRYGTTEFETNMRSDELHTENERLKKKIENLKSECDLLKSVSAPYREPERLQIARLQVENERLKAELNEARKDWREIADEMERSEG